MIFFEINIINEKFFFMKKSFFKSKSHIQSLFPTSNDISTKMGKLNVILGTK